MIFPISDDDSRLQKTGWLTILFILVNIVVFVVQIQNPGFTEGYSAIPKEITTNTDLVEPVPIQARGQTAVINHTPGPKPIFLTLFTAMFMHGSLLHIGSNMLFLWIFGDNVEIRFGGLRFVLFYVASGVAASLTHIVLAPNSVIPSLGASGAIAGILGAYLVLFPRNRVNCIVFFWVVSIPAIIVILLWGVMQFLPLLNQRVGAQGGVAYAAHVGGLLTGVILGLVFRFVIHGEPDSLLLRNYRRDTKAKQLW